MALLNKSDTYKLLRSNGFATIPYNCDRNWAKVPRPFRYPELTPPAIFMELPTESVPEVTIVSENM
jgi:hypothetical protein